ncbi:MAG TPA: metalloregulator ArsR/SmtB family transcription factor [Kofleriaceae bacterium]|nr:metalloregulator ArsR/SmtB family transcription factor [Kofleriaceae bacterium]
MGALAIDGTLLALADPARRRTIELLRAKPRRAGELAEATGLTAPQMSKHLRVLRTHGLVEEERGGPDDDARVRVYRLRREPFAELGSWLDEVEAFWTNQLQAFKRHVEDAAAKRGRAEALSSSKGRAERSEDPGKRPERRLGSKR